MSADHFGSVVAELPDFAVLVDPLGRTIEVANRAVATLRWTPEALIGRSIDELLPDLGELDQATTEPGVSRPLVTPVGDEIPVDLRSAALVTPAGVRRYLLTARDATQRIESEVRLLRMAAMERAHVRTLESVIGAMEDGVALIGPDGIITVANEALALMMGGGPVETRQDLERATGVVAGDGDATLVATGRQVSIRSYAINDGLDHSTLLVVRDVTEERRAAAAQDAFIGVLSHELRTPVTTIVGFAELMIRGGQGRTRDGTDLLPDLVAEAMRLAQLVEDLLVLSRAQGGRMTVDVEPVLVDRVIADAVAAEARRDPQVRFVIETDGRLPPVDGDMTYLGQVLRNIIGNAAKYGPSPGVVTVRSFASEGAVTVSVLDDGPGFDLEEGEQLFDIFFRSARTAGSQTGSGIGLYVARTLVEAMGGTIWARLREGGGSEFGFSLPIIDVTDPGSEWTTAPTSTSQRG